MEQFYFSSYMMRQSSRRSKEVLKNPIDTGKPITDYQQYEHQLSNYQQSNKRTDIADLFDWSKPSGVISLQNPRSQQPSHPSHQEEKNEEQMQNNSMNTEQLLRSQGDPHQNRQQQYSDGSFQVQNPSRPSFLQRIQQDYGQQYRSMSCADIETEMKMMRSQIMSMNEKLNRMLDKYELLAQPIRKEVQISNPHLFLTKQLELNAKILATQADEIRHIHGKQRVLDKKDYLVELNQLIIQIGKEIYDMGKEKHSKWVDVQRIDRLLKELEDMQGTEDEYREVKELKNKIVYYFKKLKEQKMQEEQLDLEMEKLIMKDNQLTKKLEQYTQLAVQKSLEVSTNKKYLQLKKKYQQLVVSRESSKKKKDIAAKFMIAAQQRIQREIQTMSKDLQRIGMQVQQLQYKSITIDGETNDFIKQHNILNRQIKSISYRFDESLIHAEKQKFKPDFKRSRMDGSKETNKSLHQPTEKTCVRVVNDKNMTIDETSSNGQRSSFHDSKLKPVLRLWKGKPQNPRYMDSPSGKQYKTLQSSNIFRPPLMLRHKK